MGGQAPIPAGGIHNSIKARASGGGITEVIVEPVGHVCDTGVGITVFVAEATVSTNLEADVINPIKHSIDKIKPELSGVCTIILYKVVSGFFSIFIISV